MIKLHTHNNGGKKLIKNTKKIKFFTRNKQQGEKLSKIKALYNKIYKHDECTS